jgi:predicted acyltransferase (DUF342 family)
VARADIKTLKIEYDKRIFDLPQYMRDAVILHENCHIEGNVTEYEADCCAAKKYVLIYGESKAIEVLQYWIETDLERSYPWFICRF